MKIVVDSAIPYIEGVLEPYATVNYVRGAEISPRMVHDADALIIRTRTRCDRGLLEGSSVRFIATATIGSDHIDLDYCRSRGIVVTTAAGCNARAVLQWVAGVVSLLCRQDECRPDERTLGVVGVGHVGTLIASYARLWGFHVMCSDPPREQAEHLGRADGYYPLGEIAAQADIITFHTPLTRQGPDATYGLVDAKLLAMIRRGCTILNSSRGEVVDEEALRANLIDGRIRCAIDTWPHEPGIDRQLLAHALVATPHIAGYSAQGKANGTAMSIRQLASHFALPLTDWFPSGVEPQRIRPVSWRLLQTHIFDYFDPVAQSARLKAHPEEFEQLREEYRLREEFF